MASQQNSCGTAELLARESALTLPTRGECGEPQVVTFQSTQVELELCDCFLRGPESGAFVVSGGDPIVDLLRDGEQYKISAV